MNDRASRRDFQLWEAECAIQSRAARFKHASLTLGRWLLAACSSQCPFTVAALRLAAEAEAEHEPQDRRDKTATPPTAEAPRTFELD